MITLVVVSAAIAAGVALVAVGAALKLLERQTVRSNLRLASTALEAVDRTDQVRASHEPVMDRVIVPFLHQSVRVLARLSPRSYVDSARKRLALAGRPQQAALDRFLAARVVTVALTPLVLVAVALLPLSRFAAIVSFAILAMLLLLGPEASLNRKIARRQESIRHQLADLIDLLTISVEAGLGFEQALSRTVTAMPGALSEEFTRVLGETRMGSTRRDAFNGIADRTDVPELRSFLVALSQAELFGISIVQLLRSQSEEMRIVRRQRAQEKAQKAPVKMMFPLVFCIMPVLFVVVAGPAAIEIYRNVIH